MTYVNVWMGVACERVMPPSPLQKMPTTFVRYEAESAEWKATYRIAYTDARS